MKKLIAILLLLVGILAGFIFGLKIFNGSDTATLDMSARDTQTVALGSTIDEAKYTAKNGKDEDVTDKVKVTVKMTDDTKLTGAMKPVVKDGKITFNYAGDYTIIYSIKDDEGKVLDSQEEAVKVSEADLSDKGSGLAICMYHYVYDPANPPDNLNNNFISTTDLSAELEYLNSNNYYYPTWSEVRAYVDGKLALPEKSIVITFDDGAVSFLDLGIPILEKHKVPATSFLITSKEGASKVSQYKSDYVSFQSHSDNMHRAGGNIGHGGIFTALSEEEAVADLNTSIDICGNGDAFAYPFGDYNDNCEAYVKEAGFKCAVTTNFGKVYPGDDPLLLNRVRMFEGQSLDSFASAI